MTHAIERHPLHLFHFMACLHVVRMPFDHLTCMGVLGKIAAVSALKALQNSIIFSPSGPSACKRRGETTIVCSWRSSTLYANRPVQ
jgi:hypothetical protein